MAKVKLTSLAILLLAAGCSRKPEPPAPADKARSAALEVYDVSVNSDNITKGQQISFCFKAKNAALVTGFPGKFFRNGAVEGDCLTDKPQIDTMYRIEITGADGAKRSQTAYVKVRQSTTK